MSLTESVDFGYQQVGAAEKTVRVERVFASVAPRYDLMNDLMSGGLHRLWKRYAVQVCGARPGSRVLDVACGTGDMCARLARVVGCTGSVIGTDINAAMLERGRDRLMDEGWLETLQCVRADAESLPFAGHSFDVVTIAFGLRNVTHKERALQSMLQVLRPGGCLTILEFSRPVFEGLRTLYDAYSFRVLPALGEMVAGDRDSYQYLVESIRRHPDQATLGAMMETAGFARVGWNNLTGGIVAVHRGYRL
jgi:demethylmenaquinone methyltransferase/2-methoxy-6-polyprenyl-1,4-benzoquinol methylase